MKIFIDLLLGRSAFLNFNFGPMEILLGLLEVFLELAELPKVKKRRLELPLMQLSFALTICKVGLVAQLFTMIREIGGQLECCLLNIRL